MTDLRGLRAKAGISFGTRALTLVLGIPSNILLARYLLPDERGVFAVVIGTAVIALSVGHCSVESSNPIQWRDEAKRPALGINSIVAGSGLGTAAAAVAWVAAGLIGIEALRGARLAFAVALVGVPLIMCALSLGTLTILRGNVARFDASRLSASLLNLLVLLGLALTGRLSVLTATVSWVLAAATQLAILVRRSDLDWNRWSWPVLRRTVIDGLRYHGGIVALFLLWRVDVIILAALSPPREVGWYALAVSVAESVYLVSGVVTHHALARQVEARYEYAHRYTWRVVRISFAACSVMAAAIAASAVFMVPFVFGTAYRGAVPALVALLPGIVALGATQPSAALIVRQNRPLLTGVTCAVALAVSVALTGALAPHYGALGAALASTISYSGLAVAYMFYLGGNPRQQIPPDSTGLSALESTDWQAASPA